MSDPLSMVMAHGVATNEDWPIGLPPARCVNEVVTEEFIGVETELTFQLPPPGTPWMVGLDMAEGPDKSVKVVIGEIIDSLPTRIDVDVPIIIPVGVKHE